MSIYYQIERLINFAIQNHLIMDADIIYIRNQYLELFNLEHQNPVSISEILSYPDEILNSIYISLSKDNPNLLSTLGKTKDSINCRIMNILLGKPSNNIQKFEDIKSKYNSKTALEYWYKLNIASYYIKMYDVKKNQHWFVNTQYGTMEITINRSKPEKDPKEIAKLKSQDHSITTYPKCLLCIENEGYSGNRIKPARQNHRLLPIVLNNQTWYFQFSPYVYYPEHSIIISKHHRDISISPDTFKTMFDFVDIFSHYIVGSNADLPIVGGSILNHDHYQAGFYTFPIEKALDRYAINLPKYPQVKCSIVDWPVSTIRLIGSKDELQNLAELILNQWRVYNNPGLGIIAHTENIPHNTITPIMRKLAENTYRLDILLRNNRASHEYPDGIFHPHPRFHHIKKENIGLIEAMGLAILPGRLNSELSQIKQLLSENNISSIEKIDAASDLLKHKEWLLKMFKKYQNFNNLDLDHIIKAEITSIFVKVLTDTGVFKNTKEQMTMLHQFLTMTMG